MPSLRSNKNKKGIPTLPVPATSVCIPVNVPDDPRWIALFLGAIYQLSQQIWYDRDAEHSAKIVADTWRDIYLETVKATWDCSGMFDLRIDPLDECSIQKTNDGETWIEVFRLDTRCAIANIVRNPYTGTLGYWDDLEFYTIPDGPWTPSLYPEFSSNPPPIAGIDKECLAATTAAYVLRNLYKTVADTLLDEVGATDWDYATNLGLALQGFLMLIGAAAMQVYVSIASLLGIVGVRQQYIDYPLDNDDEELLKCILLEHATEHSSGSVTFDFQGVWDDINLDSPKNGLVRFLLTMIGPDALNYAGAVDAGLSADCSSCNPTWCYQWDFTASNGGFGAINAYCGQLYGSYTGGAWQSRYTTCAGSPHSELRIAKNVDAPYDITAWELDYDASEEFEALLNLGTPVVVAAGTGTLHVDVSKTISTQTRLDLAKLSSNATLRALRLRVYGSGSNPLGTDNC